VRSLIARRTSDLGAHGGDGGGRLPHQVSLTSAGLTIMFPIRSTRVPIARRRDDPATSEALNSDRSLTTRRRGIVASDAGAVQGRDGRVAQSESARQRSANIDARLAIEEGMIVSRFARTTALLFLT
jgi:hypothetical protein